ncbi:LamG domain-containing protein [Colwellia echini]|uniref:LamG domain-containing protein n=2 Tax=Colwellia echini TaxID=1982103 RepID=A0ABY3MW43_9GAMM|nr:LamG domain-containing protein [Colwellia echini]
MYFPAQCKQPISPLINKAVHQSIKQVKIYLLLSLVLLVSACGDSKVEEKPPIIQDTGNAQYTGPAPTTEDIQKFKTALWDNMSATDRCGSCHTEGNQAPYFASRENVNDAYAATNLLVTLSKPEDSRLVTKVAGGHNCWLDSDQACGETMQQWIKLWADDRVSTANTIELKAPVIKEPGSSKNFPVDNTLFATHVYPIVTQYCASCHNEASSTAQSPFFASDDIDKAYEIAKQVINLENPEKSRLVLRLRSEFHNCWNDCATNSDEMETAIQAMSDEISVDIISPEMVISKSLLLTDGLVASSGGRFETDVIALYQFKTGSGNTAYDTSGISPAANLTLTGNVEWLGSWGLSFTNGKAQASTANSKKIHDLITSTNEFSVEAWVTPNNVSQEGPARIVSYSAGDSDRNFTLGQTLYNYDFMLQTADSDSNGTPTLSTPNDDEVLQATLQHVVLTYSAIEGRRIYVNGKLIEITDEAISPLASWDDSFALILGREASNNHVWQGNIRLLAIYNRAITQANIAQNYNVGVGEKFFLLFSVSELVELANTYILFEVSQYDNYSYLFTNPSLVNLDGKTLPDDTLLKGLRIGVNGKESAQGQTYANLTKNLSASQAITEPLALSPLGTIIALDKGASNDEFFLSFEQLGEHSNVRSANAFTAPTDTFNTTDSAKIGLRNFAQINASMSVLTGVNKASENVAKVYELVKQQLPTLTSIETFISAQQMGITQLAIAYCDAAIEDNSIRETWFPDIDLNEPPADIFNDAGKANLINPLLEQLMPSSLTTQPDKSGVYTELDALTTRLAQCGSNCAANRSKSIAKANCAAVLASAVMLVQ